ncbi:hypothetical protein PoMZ_13474 [Pyricularia oryzae]|uniref:Uncharacterized protein n=1 Tax=Pyricularia oryzae TaxID=318829 RepID=A0A4P7NV66_PYROR|nr:hypothetical protein PoMZ_13474 [Pyricularia oryzae]
MGKDEVYEEEQRQALRLEAFFHEGESWRRMLVQQPVCEKLRFIQQTRGSGDQQSFASAVQQFPICDASADAGEVRMGSHYDLCVSYCVLWRLYGADPPLSEWYRNCGGYEVYMHNGFTHEWWCLTRA